MEEDKEGRDGLILKKRRWTLKEKGNEVPLLIASKPKQAQMLNSDLLRPSPIHPSLASDAKPITTSETHTADRRCFPREGLLN